MPAATKIAIKATPVSDIDLALEKPGAFEIIDVNVGMMYVCPCGCKRVGYLPLVPHPSPSWAWDGNKVYPTLTPSIHDMSDRHPGDDRPVTHWHGWLKAGVWEER